MEAPLMHSCQVALPTGYVGSHKKCPSNLNKCSVLPTQLIPPTYPTSNIGDVDAALTVLIRCSQGHVSDQGAED
jgi:hypothetical protein